MRVFLKIVTALTVACSAVPQNGAAQNAKAVALVKHMVTSDGHPIALWEKRPARAKRSIVLVHGRTWSALPDFDLQVAGEHRSLMDALVAKGYAVYAIDLRGYGATARDSTGWTTPNQSADDVAAALRWVMAHSRVPGKPSLMGWSNGSTIAQLLAQRHPELIANLILTGYWKDSDALIALATDTIVPLRGKTTAQAAASDFIAPNAISPRALKAYVAAAVAADPVRSDWRRREQFNALDPAKLTVPTLLIQGELDPLAPTAFQAKFFARLGTVDRQWVVIAGGDHAVLIENTQPAFVSAMVNFIERPVWTKP